MPDLPAGAVAFLFTDIEGSTRLWTEHPTAMRAALARHDELLRGVVASHGGRVFKTVGDAVCAAFGDAGSALAAAVSAQRALSAEPWAVPEGLRVRMAVDAGPAEAVGEDYRGLVLSRTSRILDAGHGGQVLVSHALQQRVAAALPEGVALRELGEFRLRDLPDPERLFQLTADGLRGGFPALRSRDARWRAALMQPTPMVGREEELGSIRRLLLNEGVRLLTLTGTAGTGKTRLALQSAVDLGDEFEHGVAVVALATVTEPERVATALGRALGVRDGGRDPLNDLIEHLAERRMLIVLDNFEQIVDAAGTVATILAGCPRLAFLVTSREPLRVRGERELPVAPLPLPPRGPLPDPERLQEYAAVALFAQRARAADPSFRLLAANAGAVVEISRRLDGLPLALELAAARVRLLSPQALLERLGKRLSLLTTGARDLPSRQRSLRAAIDWSHDLLTESERVTFRRLAVFVGSFALESAEAVCGRETRVLEDLSSLVEKSLVVPQREGEEPRFSLLETIREYARERLDESGEAQTVQASHRAHFLDLAEAAASHLREAGQRPWLKRLERDHDNLRAALAWSLERGEPEPAGRIARCLWWWWSIQGHVTEGRGWMRRILALGAGLTPSLRAALQHGAGALASDQSDYRDAERLLNEALEIWRATGDRRGLASSLKSFSIVLGDRGQLARAMRIAEEGLAIDRELGDEGSVAYWLDNIAVLLLGQGAYVRAEPLLLESLELHRKRCDSHGIAITLSNLGEVARDTGDLDRAGRLYEEALEGMREVSDRPSQATLLCNLADLARRRGQPGRARALYVDSLRMASELGLPRTQAWAVTGLAETALAEGLPNLCVHLFALADRLRETIGYGLTAAEERSLQADLAAARATLGEGAFESAWEAGRGLDPEAALSLVPCAPARAAAVDTLPAGDRS